MIKKNGAINSTPVEQQIINFLESESYYFIFILEKLRCKFFNITTSTISEKYLRTYRNVKNPHYLFRYTQMDLQIQKN